MGILTCPCKCALGIINTVFLLVGVLVMALGGILLAMAKNDSFSRNIEQIIKDIIKNIGVIPGDNSNLDQIDFVGLLQPAGLAIFFSGAVVAGIAIIGYCGISCYDIILKLYLLIIVIILIVQIILVAVFFGGGANGNIRSAVDDVVKNKYVDIDDNSIYSVIPNIIMIKAGCCGVEGYQDFYDARWNMTRAIIPGPGQPEVVVNLTIPIACCKTRGEFPNVEIIDYMCPVSPNDNTSNWNTGCWKSISEELQPYETAAILVSCAVLVIQLVIIIVVVLIICDD